MRMRLCLTMVLVKPDFLGGANAFHSRGVQRSQDGLLQHPQHEGGTRNTKVPGDPHSPERGSEAPACGMKLRTALDTAEWPVRAWDFNQTVRGAQSWEVKCGREWLAVGGES